MKTQLYLALATTLLFSGATVAAEFKKLEGSYALTSESMVDPAPDAKHDRLVVFIEGSAAKEAYQAMSAPARKNACDAAIRTKTAGGLACSRNLSRDDYQCTVGVLLKSGASVSAVAC
ncbi:MAG TPA: hypothetical protein VIP30_17355 [Stenotrophomonas sp.]